MARPSYEDAAPDLGASFDRNRDPLVAAQLDDADKTEAARREEQSSRGSDMVEKDQPVLRMKPSPELRRAVDAALHFADLYHEYQEAARVMGLAPDDITRKMTPAPIR